MHNSMKERHPGTLKGSVLIWLMSCIVLVLMAVGLGLCYIDGTLTWPYGTGGMRNVLRMLIYLGIGWGLVDGTFSTILNYHRNSSKKKWTGLYSLIAGSVFAVVLKMRLRNILVAMWPVIVLEIATAFLYREEGFELETEKSQPVLWTSLYFIVSIVLISIFTATPYWGVDYTDPISYLYMILVADMAYLLFAKSSRRKLPMRFMTAVFFNCIWVVPLYLKSERMREIVRSLFYELRGIEHADNLGWISFHLGAFFQNIKGDYTQLNPMYMRAFSVRIQSVPLLWIRSHLGDVFLLIIIVLVIALFVCMRRYIQDDIDSKFVISVQKIILYSFVVQTVLGIGAELFFFTNTNIKIIFVGNMYSFLLWYLFIIIGRRKMQIK